jgi:hypothetical protein
VADQFRGEDRDGLGTSTLTSNAFQPRFWVGFELQERQLALYLSASRPQPQVRSRAPKIRGRAPESATLILLNCRRSLSDAARDQLSLDRDFLLGQELHVRVKFLISG